MIRVAIVAESPRLRGELSDVLRGAARFDVVASAPSLQWLGGDGLGQPRGAVVREDSAGLLTDGARRREGAIDAADVLLSDAPIISKVAEEAGAALVLLSDDDELLATLRTFRTGIALLPSTATAEQIVAAVEGVAAGLVVLHPDHAGAPTGAPVDDPLTPREREVLQMLAAGLGNKEIAARLHISDHTAKFHVSQILAKLSAASRAEAVSIAMRRGLVPL
jgi:DNA-binding NarL/FixJ family response regulator